MRHLASSAAPTPAAHELTTKSCSPSAVAKPKMLLVSKIAVSPYHVSTSRFFSAISSASPRSIRCLMTACARVCTSHVSEYTREARLPPGPHQGVILHATVKKTTGEGIGHTPGRRLHRRRCYRQRCSTLCPCGSGRTGSRLARVRCGRVLRRSVAIQRASTRAECATALAPSRAHARQSVCDAATHTWNTTLMRAPSMQPATKTSFVSITQRGGDANPLATPLTR